MKKNLFVAVLVLCAVLAIAVAGTAFTRPLIDMLRGTAILKNKMSLLIHKASAFDQDAALRKLKPNCKNNAYFLFCEHLDMAAIDRQPSQPPLPVPGSFCGFTFDTPQAPPLVFYKAEYRICNGICAIKCAPGSFMTNTRELSLEKSGLSEIEIRLKAKQGKNLLVGLSSNPAAQWRERDKIIKRVRVEGFEFKQKDICVMPLAIVPDNTFRTYSMNVESALASAWINFNDAVRKFFISFPEISGNEIEIDYIRFVTKKEKFLRTPCDRTYIQKDNEFRSALYMNTPCRLRYTVPLAQAPAYLSFGTGVLESGDPVEFKVSLESNNTETVLFLKKADDPGIWTFEKLDLSAYAGKTVSVIFSAASRTGNIAFWSNPVIYTQPKEKLNVILVLEDALRADHLSVYGYTARATSPFREKFARSGVVFENAFSQATETRPSCPSLMTSLFPTAAGAGLNHETLSEQYLTLAEIMWSQGFATASIIQNANAGYYNGLHQGFSRVYDLGDFNTKTADVYGTQLKSWLDDEGDRNFFLYLHVIDPHGPYDPPSPFDQWYREAHRGDATLPEGPSCARDPECMDKLPQEDRRLLYDGEVRNNDYWFEKFYEMLASRDLLKNTLLILISDHGEHLGERRTWGHLPPGYVQGIHVPLIMAYPRKLPAGKVLTPPVQLIDLMPTILDSAGIDTDGLVLQGDSLLPLIHETGPDFWNSRICFSEEVVNRRHKFDSRPFGSLIIGSWHFLNSAAFLPELLHEREQQGEFNFFKIFNLKNDPDEINCLSGYFYDHVLKPVAGNILTKFHENNKTLHQKLSKQPRQIIHMDPVVNERLRDLGYLE
jgi:arylsulfatase A-like enzyme